MSQKTDWDAHRQRGNLIRRTLLAATDIEGAMDRLLTMGYTEEEIAAVIERMQP